MGILDKAKDFGVRVAVNKLLGGIGNFSSLTINRNQRVITGQIILTGEQQPIEITIAGWEFGEEPHPDRVRLLSLTSSRPWLDELAQRALVNRWFDVPHEHMGKLKLALE